MAALSQGIVGGEMAWPLVIVGIAMGISLILIKVRSPMLFSVGMYLPLETTFAIFIGGADSAGSWTSRCAKRGYNDAQKARVENAGVLVASGLIAGEALMGLVIAGVVALPQPTRRSRRSAGSRASRRGWRSPVFALLFFYMTNRPLSKAGAPDEPAPPTAVM